MKYIKSFSELADLDTKYDTIACDIYGVLHDGYEPYPYTLSTLQHLTKQAPQVILLSNSSRMYKALSHQLANTFNIQPDAYNDILSSGRLTRLFLEDCQRYLMPGDDTWTPSCHATHCHQSTQTSLTAVEFCQQQNWEHQQVRFFIAGGIDYLGPLYHDLDRFTPTQDWHDMDIILLGSIKRLYGDDPIDLYDEHSIQTHYRPFLTACVARQVPMLCTNPDVWAPSGTHDDGSQRLLICPGYIGELYKAMGGHVLYFGKPFSSIYDHLGRASLCVGDNVATDVLGATRAGLDVVLILGGVHAKDFSDDQEEEQVLDQVRVLCQEAGTQEPTYVMPYLRWN
ncbi:HAD-like domain-containing protein [Chlamydoabsidia padenii]|nr:HAD-like domain-containing protein [Chlamydoabsidia padenii]